jgi:hypothetical protein
MDTIMHPGFETELQCLSADELAAITGGYDFLRTLRAGNQGATQGAEIGGTVGTVPGAIFGAWRGARAGGRSRQRARRRRRLGGRRRQRRRPSVRLVVIAGVADHEIGSLRTRT